MIAVPGPTPNTTPFASTIAAVALLLVQTPPAVPLLTKVIVEPVQTDEGPLIVPALARGLTVTLYEANDDPQELEMK